MQIKNLLLIGIIVCGLSTKNCLAQFGPTVPLSPPLPVGPGVAVPPIGGIGGGLVVGSLRSPKPRGKDIPYICGDGTTTHSGVIGVFHVYESPMAGNRIYMQRTSVISYIPNEVKVVDKINGTTTVTPITPQTWGKESISDVDSPNGVNAAFISVAGHLVNFSNDAGHSWVQFDAKSVIPTLPAPYNVPANVKMAELGDRRAFIFGPDGKLYIYTLLVDLIGGTTGLVEIIVPDTYPAAPLQASIIADLAGPGSLLSDFEVVATDRDVVLSVSPGPRYVDQFGFSNTTGHGIFIRDTTNTNPNYKGTMSAFGEDPWNFPSVGVNNGEMRIATNGVDIFVAFSKPSAMQPYKYAVGQFKIFRNSQGEFLLNNGPSGMGPLPSGDNFTDLLAAPHTDLGPVMGKNIGVLSFKNIAAPWNFPNNPNVVDVITLPPSGEKETFFRTRIFDPNNGVQLNPAVHSKSLEDITKAMAQAIGLGGFEMGDDIGTKWSYVGANKGVVAGFGIGLGNGATGWYTSYTQKQ